MRRNERGELVNVVLQELRRRNGDLTETAAANLVAVSPSWFRHRFRRTTGMSFRHARLQAKLEYGKYLLGATDCSIPDISATLGYSDRTKLEKAFKRAYGVTPTRYRERLRSPRSLVAHMSAE